MGVTRRTTTGSREPLHFQQRSQLTARSKTGEGKQRNVSGLRPVAGDGSTHTGIVWHASPDGVGLSSSPVTAFYGFHLTPSAPTTSCSPGARPAHDGRIGLHVAHCSAKADTHAGSRTHEVV